MRTQMKTFREEMISELLTCYLNWGEEVESQEQQPERHCSVEGQGCSPSSASKAECVWCELKSHLPSSVTLCHPGPLYRAHDQGTQTTRLRDFHTGYYIVFDDLTFTSFSNQSFFLFSFFGGWGYWRECQPPDNVLRRVTVDEHQPALWNVGA